MVCIIRLKEKNPEKKKEGDWEAAESKGLPVLSFLPVSLAVSPPGRRFHGAGLCLVTFCLDSTQASVWVAVAAFC